jgi:hypothetical protein
MHRPICDSLGRPPNPLHVPQTRYRGSSMDLHSINLCVHVFIRLYIYMCIPNTVRIYRILPTPEQANWRARTCVAIPRRDCLLPKQLTAEWRPSSGPNHNIVDNLVIWDSRK